MRQRTLTILQRLTLLSLFSYVVSNESFLQNDIDYEALLSEMLMLKEKCTNHPDQPPCSFSNSIQEESDSRDKIQTTNLENATTFNRKIPEDDVLIEIPFTNFQNSMEKRFAVFRRRNPNAQTYKRGPGFRSWGGKRTSVLIADPDRSKFASWGGKRKEGDNDIRVSEEGNDLTKLESTEEVNFDKKSKFTSWGGKRDNKDDSDGMDKRTKFTSWGGKRNNYDASDDVENNKRTKFVSWGGKRDLEIPISYDQMEKRGLHWRSFAKEPFKKHVPKRPQFQSWGGKRTLPLWNGPLGYYIIRTPSSHLIFTKLPNADEKRKFSSWGGKRDNQSKYMLGEKNSKPEVEDENFGNFSGLREKREGKMKSHSKTFPYESRSDFNSWGGKRDENLRR